MLNTADRAQVYTPTIGNSILTLGNATSSYQSFSAAGLIDNNVVEYVLTDGLAWEIGTGVIGNSVSTLTRNLRSSSTGSLLNLSGSAIVEVAPTANTITESLASPSPIGSITPNTGAFTTLIATTPPLMDNTTNVATTIWVREQGYLTNSSVPNATVILTGDITGTGPTGSNIVTTLATVNPDVGSYGTSTQVASITVNSKGLITAVTSTNIAYPVVNSVNYANYAGSALVSTLANTAVTQPLMDNSTNIATTQWVNEQGYISNTTSITTALANVASNTIVLQSDVIAINSAISTVNANVITTANALNAYANTANTAISNIAANTITLQSEFASINSVVTLVGDVTGHGNTGTNITTTLSNVNTSVGTYGSATQVATITVNAKGLVTSMSNTTITYPSITSVNYANYAGSALVATTANIAVTQAAGDNTTNIATTAFTGTAITNFAGSDPYFNNGLGGSTIFVADSPSSPTFSIGLSGNGLLFTSPSTTSQQIVTQGGSVSYKMQFGTSVDSNFVIRSASTGGGPYSNVVQLLFPTSTAIFANTVVAVAPSLSDNSTTLVTSAWVVAQGYSTGGSYLPLTGGTITGSLTIDSGLYLGSATPAVLALDGSNDVVMQTPAGKSIIMAAYTGSAQLQINSTSIVAAGTSLVAGDNTSNVATTAFVQTAIGQNSWTPQLHQGSGGTNSGHELLWADQNIHIQNDGMWILCQDQSLYTQIQITGTPTTGESPGVVWTVANTAFHINYTVQSTDTTDQAVALGLANAIASNSGLTTALANFKGADGIGYLAFQTGFSNQTTGGSIYLDQPWAASGNSLTANSSTHITVSIGSPLGGSTPKLDGNPILTMTRYVAGYQPSANDQGPIIYFQGQKTTSGYTQIGAISMLYTGDGSSTFGTRMLFNACDDTGTSQNVMAIGKGLYLYNGSGSPSLGDMGAGSVSANAMYANDFYLGNATPAVLALDGSNDVVVQAPSSKSIIMAAYTGATQLIVAPTAITVTGGILHANSGITTITPPTVDNTTNVATTAWVVAQGYSTGGNSVVVTLVGDVTGNGSTGSNITTTLANTTVTPGTYTLSTIVVDSKGRITNASNGVGGGGGSYLPLTGGTLTGALLGTSGSFTNMTISVSGGFTGIGTATTPPTGDSTGNIATTAFVQSTAGSYLPLAGGTLTGSLVTTAVTINSGVNFGNQVGANSIDLSKHINLNTSGTGYGFNVTSYTLNYSVPASASHIFGVNGSAVGKFSQTGLNNTPVGQTTAAAGAFTALTSSATLPAGDNTTNAATTAFVYTAVGSYLPLAGGTLTGAIIGTVGTFTSFTVNSTMQVGQPLVATAAAINFNTATATTRYSNYYTNSVSRWISGVDSTAESGSNVGSQWTLNAYSDAGAFLYSPILVARANGIVQMAQGVSAGNTIVTNTISIRSATNTTTQIQWQNGTNNLWQLGTSGNQSNTDLGGNLALVSYHDNGVVNLSNVATFYRSNGVVVIGNTVVTKTQATGDNSTNVATTAFVQTTAGAYLPLTGGTMTAGFAINASNPSINLLNGGTLSVVSGSGSQGQTASLVLNTWQYNSGIIFSTSTPNITFVSGTAHNSSGGGAYIYANYFSQGSTYAAWQLALGDGTGSGNFSSAGMTGNFTLRRPTGQNGALADTPLSISAQNGNATFSQNVISNGVTINGATATTTRTLSYQTSGALRFVTGLSNTAESANTNVGSNYIIQSYSDNAATVVNTVTIYRSNGLAAFSNTITTVTQPSTDNSTNVATTAFVGNYNSLNYMPLTNGTFSGQLYYNTSYPQFTISASSGDSKIILNGGTPLTGGAEIVLNAANSASVTGSTILYQNGGTNRWAVTGTSTESGSNLGSNLVITPYNDGGSAQTAALTIYRSNGVAKFGNTITTITQPSGDNTTNVATTAYVQTAITTPTVSSITANSANTTITIGSNSTINITCTANSTYTLSNGINDGQYAMLRFSQNASGSWTIAFGTNVHFGTDITGYTPSTTANATDCVGVQWRNSTSQWLCLAIARGY